MENGSTKWRDGLLEVAMHINSQKHSVTGYTSYNVVLRHRFRTEAWIPSNERQQQSILNEDGTRYSEQDLRPTINLDPLNITSTSAVPTPITISSVGSLSVLSTTPQPDDLYIDNLCY